MSLVFYGAAVVALLAATLLIFTRHVLRASLYALVMLLASALVYISLQAYLPALLQTVVFGGVVLGAFIAVVRLRGLSRDRYRRQEARSLQFVDWIGPVIFSVILTALLLWALSFASTPSQAVFSEPSLTVPGLLMLLLVSILLVTAVLGARQLIGSRGKP